jgi:hypothetical protein
MARGRACRIGVELRMRLALVLVLSLVMSGCAILRKDKEEPVEAPPDRESTEPMRAPRGRSADQPTIRPSDLMRPDSAEIASPVSDHFAFRLTYFQPSITTDVRLDPTNNQINDGTLLSGEDDLGLDDQANQLRAEFDLRMGKRHHLRADFFKLSRFKEQPLPRDIDFGDFSFQEGDNFRTKLDWRVLSLTYTYQFLRFERFEAGLGMGLHVIQAQAEGGEPGTLNRERDTEVGIFPTIAANAAYRISKRWAITARGQTFSASPEGFEGTMSDYHVDLQYRWRENLAVGLGWSKLESNLEVLDADQQLLFDLDAAGPELFVRVSF